MYSAYRRRAGLGQRKEYCILYGILLAGRLATVFSFNAHQNISAGRISETLNPRVHMHCKGQNALPCVHF